MVPGNAGLRILETVSRRLREVIVMRKAQKLAAGIAAAMVVSTMSAPVSFAADNAFGIDELNWTDEDWNSIAMANDDTVDTGAVIRTGADVDSKAAGYLYRGAAVQVVNKGEEWTEVKSGNVTGFVKNEFLAFGDQARGLASHYGRQGIIANWDDVNVFADDDADSDITTQLSDGTPMSMLEDNGHWITVQHGADSAGFVSEDDVSRVLLVDTAVPADGEDVADVPATMTSYDIPSLTAAEASVPQGNADSAEGTDVSYDPAPDASETQENAYSEDASVYAQDSTGQESYAQDSYSQDSYAQESYTQDSTGQESYTQDSYSQDSYAQESTGQDSYSQDSYSQDSSTQDSSSGTQMLTAETVSDDAQIQALYEAYIEAQNAAMDCTSEADAQARADAAIAAWNTYVAACGETSAAVPVSSSAGDSSATDASCENTAADTSYENAATDASYDTAATDTSYDTTAADTSYDSTAAGTSYEEYTDTSAEQSAASAESQAADSSASSSSGENAYGSVSDLDLLAAIIWCEAGNQSYDGMVAVGQVVMDRVASPSFPNSISEVLNQPGQFTPASSGVLQSALASGVNSTCYSAASDAMSGAAPVPGYPLYFNTHSGSYQLGAHYFS